MSDSPDKSDAFRDSLATIDQRGHRKWVYPTQPVGPLYRWRTAVAMVLLTFLFGAPFIRVGGNPLLQIDLLNRKFFIFGAVFWPQDFYIFVLSTIALVVLIILFTAAFGRLFCGWICPQTIFMEMVFRRIEYWLEGNGPRQRELAHSPWTANKLVRKTAKQAIFFGLSFLIGNTFLAYIIGTKQLLAIVTDSPLNHLTGLTAMLLFSGAFYFVFAWFREQACTLVCPYGRLQSVLLDNNSVVIAYDFKRGEPRGPVMRGRERAPNGDCIDCLACVRVCPTGIDIRNGTQLECVNCTACIDACNRVMARMKWRPGLIRYASYNSIALGQKLRFTPRMGIYTAVLLILVASIGFFMSQRSQVETTILRTTGSLYQLLDNGVVRNLYTVSIANKTSDTMKLDLRLKSPAGQATVVGPALVVPPQGLKESIFTVEIPRTNLFAANSGIVIDVISDGKVLDEVRSTFDGPDPRKHEEQKEHEEHESKEK
ncbi:cytochrome c oxidase accessory protein CcoG [candidate division GN15 bacterium]|uniref:Cytochrome c oxidase accessory protein CcoG n=1 Tax=candidate division GN15 bacterium TaxID=2072418 RepID=A0A855X9U9_9BACT|nr:MAG: cytochrome c oxidase accessory protein CcoG [candidate division GN15 bacterium]